MQYLWGKRTVVQILDLCGPNCSARWSFDVCAAKCLRVTLNWIRFWTVLQCNHCKCHHHSYSLFKSNNYPFKWCRMIWARLFIKSLSNTRLTLAHTDNIRDRDFIVYKLCAEESCSGPKTYHLPISRSIRNIQIYETSYCLLLLWLKSNIEILKKSDAYFMVYYVTWSTQT